jgi:threonine/homoserine/homoserine lactone efflux protein
VVSEARCCPRPAHIDILILVPTDLLAFVSVSLVVIVTPGQDTALTIRNVLLGGRRAGVATAVGVAAGQAIWALATGVGLAALIVASEPVFVAIKLAGAGYLVYLGARSLMSAWRGGENTPVPVAGGGRTVAPAFRQGLLSNLGNPKMAVFFTSLLPQFAASGDGSLASLLALGLAFCAMTLAWLCAYSLVVARASDVLRRPLIRRMLDAVMGAVFTILGLRVATSSR